MLSYFAGFPCEPSFFWQLVGVEAGLLVIGLVIATVIVKKIPKTYRLLAMVVTLLIAAMALVAFWHAVVPGYCKYSFLDNFRETRDRNK